MFCNASLPPTEMTRCEASSGHSLQLAGQGRDHRAIFGKEADRPLWCDQVPEMGRDVRCPGRVSGVIEDRIAQERDVTASLGHRLVVARHVPHRE